MVKLRKAQMDAFQAAAHSRFELEMLEHAKRFAPKHGEVIKDEGTLAVVRLGIERSKKYKFDNRGPIRTFIEMMFMFGSDFDTDPQYAWAQEILTDDAIGGQMTRAQKLFAKVSEYLTEVAGPNNEFAKQALQRASKINFDDIEIEQGNLSTRGMDMMREFYPEKVKFTGAEPLKKLLHSCTKRASSFGIENDRGTALFFGLAFILGHGFAADPQFPWIEKTLKNEKLKDMDKRIEKLFSKMMTYLNHVLEFHAEENASCA